MKGWTLELYKLWYKPSQAASAMVLPFQSNHHWLSAIYCALLQMSPSISCLPYLLWVPCVNNGMSRSVFFSDRGNAKNVQKSKRTVFFPQRTPKNPPKKPIKNCQWGFQKNPDYRQILRQEKNFKNCFKGKENQKGIPGHTYLPLFFLGDESCERMRSWAPHYFHPQFWEPRGSCSWSRTKDEQILKNCLLFQKRKLDKTEFL